MIILGRNTSHISRFSNKSKTYLKICQSLGWKGEGGRFDVLPLVLQASGQDPELFVIPPELIMEVEITHPK